MSEKVLLNQSWTQLIPKDVLSSPKLIAGAEKALTDLYIDPH